MSSEQTQSEQMLQLVIFRIGKEEFGAPISQVKEVITLTDITRMPKAPPFVEGVINLRGQVIAVVGLAKRLGLPSQDKDENTRIMVVEWESTTMGMIVDSVLEVIRLPEKEINATPMLVESDIKSDFIQGVGRWKGRLFVLIDLSKIFSGEEVAAHHLT